MTIIDPGARLAWDVGQEAQPAPLFLLLYGFNELDFI